MTTEGWREDFIKGLKCVALLISPLCPSLPTYIHLLRLSSPHPFPFLLFHGFFSLSFTLHFLTLRSMMRGVLYIYGHALSVCVGLSNIHLSCAAVIKSLIPSHIQRMKHEHWSRCPLVWIPTSASQQSEGERGFVQLSDKLQTGQTPSFSYLFPPHRIFLVSVLSPFFLVQRHKTRQVVAEKWQFIEAEVLYSSALIKSGFPHQHQRGFNGSSCHLDYDTSFVSFLLNNESILEVLCTWTSLSYISPSPLQVIHWRFPVWF